MSLPVRYLHSANTLMGVKDVGDTQRLLALLAQKLPEG